LGGPNAVRAYPVNEALGDQGYLLNFELRFRVYTDVDVIGFIDHGGIVLHCMQIPFKTVIRAFHPNTHLAAVVWG
jgi:hemolysin activation/secretion protein